MKSKSKLKLMFANVSVFEKCVLVVAVVAAAAVVLVSFFPLQNCQSLVSHTISFALPRVSIGTSASCWIFLYVVVSSSFSTAAAAAAASVVFFFCRSVHSICFFFLCISRMLFAHIQPQPLIQPHKWTLCVAIFLGERARSSHCFV